MKHIKTALIGFGYRGKQLLRLLRTIENFEIVGIADINGCGDSESPGASFYQGEEAYKMMLDEQQPNLVFITTPWHLHIPPRHRMHTAKLPCGSRNQRRTLPG